MVQEYYDRVDARASGISRLAEATLIGGLLTLASLAFCYVTKLPVPSYLEIAAVFTSYACTYLCVVQSRQNYYWGFISVLLYAYLFYTSNLLASSVTQLYLSGALVYGWLRWGPDAVTRPVRYTPLRLYAVYAAVTAVIYGGVYAITSYLGATLPFWDAAIMALSILAQFLLDNKRIETWIVWVAVNVIAIWLYYEMGLILVVFQYILFLGNTILGFYLWRKSMADLRSLEQ